MQVPVDILRYEILPYVPLVDLFDSKYRLGDAYRLELQRRYQENPNIVEIAIDEDNPELLSDILTSSGMVLDFYRSVAVGDYLRELSQLALSRDAVRVAEWLFEEIPSMYLDLEYSPDPIELLTRSQRLFDVAVTGLGLYSLANTSMDGMYTESAILEALIDAIRDNNREMFWELIEKFGYLGVLSPDDANIIHSTTGERRYQPTTQPSRQEILQTILPFAQSPHDIDNIRYQLSRS